MPNGIGTTSICCFGNPLHGDDGVGLYVYESLKNIPVSIPVFFFADAPLQALDVFENSDHVVLVDAVRTQNDDIEIVEVNPDDLLQQQPSAMVTSHLNSLPYLLQVATHMLAVSPQIDVIGVSINELQTYRQGISEPVQNAADKLVQLLVERYGRKHCHA